jgi:transposase-like protein
MSQAEAAVLTTRSSQYRDYPEELKAAVIAAIEQNGGQIRPTCRLFNLPYDTVHYWWTKSERFRQIKPASAQNLADKLEELAHSTADSLAEHDFSIVAARDKAAVLSVAIDKMQLLRGEPTAITGSVHREELTLILQKALTEDGPQDAVVLTESG